jgi:excisionase family DNA binding protein
MPEWITTKAAAEISGYTRQHVRVLITSGKIKGQRFGREWQVSRAGLLAYIRKAEKLGAKRGPKAGA